MGKSERAYGVSGGEFLFGGDDGAGALGFVQGAFAADDGFALRGAAVGFAADFGDGVPLVHGEGWFVGGFFWRDRWEGVRSGGLDSWEEGFVFAAGFFVVDLGVEMEDGGRMRCSIIINSSCRSVGLGFGALPDSVGGAAVV